MGARSTPPAGCTDGNFVSEWFGHRVWSVVSDSEQARSDQSGRLCPFLTVAIGETTHCVKRVSGWSEPYGVCTISSDSNGSRQEWIACPYRTLDQHFTLLETSVNHAFGVRADTETLLLPLTVLHRQDQRKRIRDALSSKARAFLFSATKLGGEIELPETEASPGAAVDMSVIEVLGLDKEGKPSKFGKHLFYEIQTADFHGSPLHAAKLLRKSCPKDAGGDGYHDDLKRRVEICGTGVEGPNKANIFKRTIYQMIYKIELAQAAECAGFAIVLPMPVWESWLKHLGKPKLEVKPGDEAIYQMRAPKSAPTKSSKRARAMVYVFDINTGAAESPSPLKIVRRVEVSADALAHHAFVKASDEAIRRGVVGKFRKSMIARISNGWKNKLPKLK